MSSPTIIDFQPEHAEAFREINLAWIREHWEPEPADFKTLDHPQANVIDPGGHILLAQHKGEIVGTAALLKMPDGGFELAKMAVAEHARGQGIGRQLALAAVEYARKAGVHRVFLESASVLKPAIALYESLGFQHISGEPSPYSRCNVQMQLPLHSRGQAP